MDSKKLFQEAVQAKREGRFGDAVNLFNEAVSAPDATEELRRETMVSIELIQEINGFVNTDLMNP